MLPYRLKCVKNIESKYPMVKRTNKGKTMLLSKYAVGGSINLPKNKRVVDY